YPPVSNLFPYTTLFRSEGVRREIGAWEVCQGLTNFQPGPLGFLARDWLQVHLDFARMGPGGVIRQFRSADTLSHQPHERKLLQFSGHLSSHPEGTLDGSTRNGRHVDDKV